MISTQEPTLSTPTMCYTVIEESEIYVPKSIEYSLSMDLSDTERINSSKLLSQIENKMFGRTDTFENEDTRRERINKRRAINQQKKKEQKIAERQKSKLLKSITKDAGLQINLPERKEDPKPEVLKETITKSNQDEQSMNCTLKKDASLFHKKSKSIKEMTSMFAQKIEDASRDKSSSEISATDVTTITITTDIVDSLPKATSEVIHASSVVTPKATYTPVTTQTPKSARTPKHNHLSFSELMGTKKTPTSVNTPRIYNTRTNSLSSAHVDISIVEKPSYVQKPINIRM
ncbi:hypothetical protein AKO1_008076 [Acrasis kona]|uniref:Uncharacterized protein n=1 Tax=Acrasis kona TaxID=1008807 RepID=A0AAW2YQN3_9EUKA